MWTEFAKECKVELAGDDLPSTNLKRIKIGEEKNACKSLLLEVNQIGSITESLAAVAEAYSAGWSPLVSHQSEETTDDFIADLAVGSKTGHLTSGTPCQGERVAKYNRLMDIKDDIEARGLKTRCACELLREVQTLK